MAAPAPALANGEKRAARWVANAIAAVVLLAQIAGQLVAYGELKSDVQQLKQEVQELRALVILHGNPATAGR